MGRAEFLSLPFAPQAAAKMDGDFFTGQAPVAPFCGRRDSGRSIGGQPETEFRRSRRYPRSSGESVSTSAEAAAARDVYLRTLDAIRQAGIQGNVSLKLTQFGLDLSYDQCLANVEQLVKQAAEHNTFVRVDMESSGYADRTLDLVPPSANATVPWAWSFRRICTAAGPIREVERRGISVRLCKGAYLEPASVAFPRKADVDRNFIEL